MSVSKKLKTYVVVFPNCPVPHGREEKTELSTGAIILEAFLIIMWSTIVSLSRGSN